MGKHEIIKKEYVSGSNCIAMLSIISFHTEFAELVDLEDLAPNFYPVVLVVPELKVVLKVLQSLVAIGIYNIDLVGRH